MESWEESAIKNGFKFLVAIGSKTDSDFEIIAVTKNYATSERIVDNYVVNTGLIILICDIQTQRMLTMTKC